MNWFDAVLGALCERDPERKVSAVSSLPPHPNPLPQGERGLHSASDNPAVPGRPERPPLVHPRDVPHRGFGNAEGRAALIHAIAHIEFNAINLALDACWRFRDMPPDYYPDWLSVAQDEARHFQMLSVRLGELGHAYGDFAAHSGLWDAAEKTRHDVLARMALVPRVLEARGLDVTPGIIERLKQAGDIETVRVLQIILDEEVRHVAIGTKWFRYLCTQRNLEPESTFHALLNEHGMSRRPPFNLAARAAAGFSPRELAQLSATR